MSLKDLCLTHTMPTWLMNRHLPLVLPLLSQIINLSLSTGAVPGILRSFVITQVLRKPYLDKEELCNERPVSNLPFLCKLIEEAASEVI